MIKKAIEIPIFSQNTSMSQYEAKIEECLQNLDYLDFVPTPEDKTLYNIDEDLRKTTSLEEIQTILIPNLISHIKKLTKDKILLENGSINPNFKSETLISYEQNIHTHEVLITVEIDSKGNVILRFKIVDNETRALGLNLAGQLILSNTTYRELYFDYYPEIVIQKETKNIFGKVKIVTEITPAKLINFRGNNQIIEDLDKLAGQPESLDIISSFFSSRFLGNLKPIESMNLKDVQYPYMRENQIVLKKLRKNLNHKPPTQSSSQSSDQP
jgi:hypothetical protein